MEVEISKADVEDTPASCMHEYVAEHISAMMALGGIESISLKRYSSGIGSRLHVSIAAFKNLPQEIFDQGVIIKDALAQIMSVANITRIVLKPKEKDMKEMRESWKKSVSDARSLNSGSALSEASARS